MLERSSNSPQARSKAQQAAEERWAALTRSETFGAPGDAARKRGFVAAYIQGREDALPEEPDPAVIEAMARALNPFAWKVRDKYMSHPNHEALELDVMVEDSIRQAWAAYAALRGAMQ